LLVELFYYEKRNKADYIISTMQGLMEFGPNAVVGKDIKELDIMQILKICV
jgi:hypothetical protein